MARSVYLAAAGPESGKSAIALGVFDAMTRRVGRVAVFRPVVRSTTDPDPVLALLAGHYGRPELTTLWGTTYAAVHADPDEALATILARYRTIERDHDGLVVVGTDYTDVGAPTELSFNGRVATNLGAPVLLVVSGQDRRPAEIRDAAELARTALRHASAPVLGIVANRVAPTDVAALRDLLGEGAHLVPELPLLAAPSVAQVQEATHARLLMGSPERLDREVLSFLVAAMTLPRVLEYLDDGALVIVPGDRSDMLVGLLMAHRSQTFPRLSGVLLTGDLEPEPVVARLIAGLGLSLPVMVTARNTFEAATLAHGTRGALTDGSPRRVDAALGLVARHVEVTGLLDRLALTRTDVVTPLMFEHDVVERARADRKRIVLPEGTEPRVLRAAATVLGRGIADVVLLGDADAVRQAAERAGADVTGAQVLDPAEPGLRHRLATEYARVRAHKGATLEQALDVVVDVSYAGTLLVALGLADGMVSGAAHTTAHTIRPAFEIIRTAPGVSVVSSVFFMCLEDRVLVYGDCAVLPDPTSEQLAAVAVSAARTATMFGVEPRVALLSYSTGQSGSGADVDKVRAATDLVRERAPGLQVEGPIQYDAATDPEVAATKLPGSPVAGRATVLIFPDLNTGNNTYKAVQRSAGALAVGPVLQGLRRPVNDLSRGATVADIVMTVAITAVQAQQLGDVP